MDKDGEIDLSAALQEEEKPQELHDILGGSVKRSEPVLEYIPDVDARIRIFEELNRLRVEPWDRLRVAGFAVFMVAPMKVLEDVLRTIHCLDGVNDTSSISCVFRALQFYAEDGIEAFANIRGDELPPTSTSPPDTPEPWPGPSAVYIFPLHVANHPYFLRCRGLIRMFWLHIWRSIEQAEDILDSARNVIRLDPKLHWYYNNGEMALKPLRKTKDGSVVVQLHWLKRHEFLPSANLQDADAVRWMQSAGLADNSAWGSNISGLPVETGQTFVLSAEDPADVPSFELLQLSWDLRRLMAISGVANLGDSLAFDGSDGEFCHGNDSLEDEQIWDAQLRKWAEGIQRDDELEDYDDPGD